MGINTKGTSQDDENIPSPPKPTPRIYRGGNTVAHIAVGKRVI
jgi:hypothetical protein